MIFHSEFCQHLKDAHSLPDICCPEYECLTHEELVGLIKVLEHEFIPYDNESARSAIRKIWNYLRRYELANPINGPAL